MVKEMTSKGCEVSIALFCLENVKYESVASAEKFLLDHPNRHPQNGISSVEKRKCLICKVMFLDLPSDYESEAYMTP